MIKLLLIIIALLLGGFGYLSIRRPEDAIYLVNQWRFNDYTPTEGHIRRTKIGGIVYIIIAIAVIVEAFIWF